MKAERRMRRRGWWMPAVSTLALVLLGACSDPSLLPAPPQPTPPADAGADAQVGFLDGGRVPLRLTRLAPDHGPFIGGNAAILRGTGFFGDVNAGEIEVRVGGNLVQPPETELLSPNELRIVLPAGTPGDADVFLRMGSEQVTLEDGYLYDAAYLEPTRGATNGGTVVELVGTGLNFQDGDTLSFGTLSCTDMVIESVNRLTCKTPPGVLGTTDVVLRRDGAIVLRIEDGFEYYDASDPYNGGLGGTPIDGSINVSVINSMTGDPEPGVFVVLGDDLSTEYQGLTNALGQIAFSGPGVVAPATVHASKHCFERTSFVSFDASDVTIFLSPWMDPACAMGMGNPPVGGVGRAGSFVEGELVWAGPNEYGPNPWSNIPVEREGWRRVAYVQMTQRCAGDSFGCRPPNPRAGDGNPQVLEEPNGRFGYRYRIFVRPGSFALYAVAGLEHLSTGEFRPYVMGVARNILVGPGETASEVRVDMDIPLDHYLDVELSELPEASDVGPDRFRVDADIDLGGEGLIVRRDANGDRTDTYLERTSEDGFRFFAQPALRGTLSDGRYRVEAEWVTGGFEAQPSTRILQTGVREVDATVQLGDFIGIPEAVSPAFGARIPDDRLVRWQLTDGGAPPSFYYIQIVGGDGNPAWRLFVPADTTEATLPDFSTIPELEDISPGFLTWAVYAVRIPGFRFDRVTYRDLRRSRWVAEASAVFTAIR